MDFIHGFNAEIQLASAGQTCLYKSDMCANISNHGLRSGLSFQFPKFFFMQAIDFLTIAR
jgi:hypothetical protein